MDKLLNSLNLSDLLRNFFAGSIAVISYSYIVKCDLAGLSGDELSLFIVMSIVSGFIIYALHRAILYPIVSKVNLIILWLWKDERYSKQAKELLNSEVTLDFERWIHEENKNSIINKLKPWFDQVHFLYCSAWAVLGSFFLRAISDFPPSYNWILFWVSGIFFVGAFIHHLRVRRRELVFYDRCGSEEWKNLNKKTRKPIKFRLSCLFVVFS